MAMGRRRMLTPWCARESAEQPVLDLGCDPADWCDAATPGQVTRSGRGRAALGDLDRFASRISGRVDDGEEITLLEPDLARRFRRGLLFRGEVNLDQRQVMAAFMTGFRPWGVEFRFGVDLAFAHADSPCLRDYPV